MQAIEITVGEIAELAGTRPATVSTWAGRFADFPVGRRDGRRVLYDRAEIVDWLERHRPAYGVTRTAGARAVDAIRTVARSDDGPEVVLALLCLTSLAPQEVADAIVDTPQPTGAISELSLRVEDQRGLPELLAPLREPDAPARFREALALVTSPGGGVRSRSDLQQTFEAVLSERAGAWARRHSDFRSPEWLAELMFDLVSDAIGENRVLLDPAAGEGGFLLTAARRASPPLDLHGWELDPGNARLARQRLLIHDFDAKIEQIDSLGNDQVESLGAAAVISDPPLALRLDANRWQAADPRWRGYGRPAPYGDLAWVLLALHHLAPGGRAAILTTRGALTRTGNEAEIRAQLLNAGAIEAIIGLPAGSTLQAGTPLALWLLHRTSAATPNRVLFLDATDTSINRGPTSRPGADEAARTVAERIRGAITGWRQQRDRALSIHDFAATHPTKTLESGDAVLDPSRLVHLPASIEELAAELKRIHKKRAQLLAQLAVVPLPAMNPAGDRSTARRMKIGELLASGRAELISGRRTNATIDGAGTPVLGPWTFQGEPPRHSPNATSQLESGDVVLTPRGHGFRARIVQEHETDAALEPPLQAIRLHPADGSDAPQLTSSLLAELINIQQAPSSGTSGRNTIKTLEIPLFAPDAARELDAALTALRHEADIAEQLQATRERLQILLIETLAR